ncbi:MAG TPA: chemotaxis protein CheW [Candidatus Acidoferrales bacterium]|nr:chemotaxis protein CheW [Candidatus Acidoferrales bacterium]
MTNSLVTSQRNYVIVPIGKRRFSFAAESVVELIAIGKLEQFPHRTSWISGVIVRRNRVVPVFDISRLLGEAPAPMYRFCLVAEWKNSHAQDWCAIPVAGECELASAEAIVGLDANTANLEPHIAGSIQVAEERIGIVDLGKLIEGCQTPSEMAGPGPSL